MWGYTPKSSDNYCKYRLRLSLRAPEGCVAISSEKARLRSLFRAKLGISEVASALLRNHSAPRNYNALVLVRPKVKPHSYWFLSLRLLSSLCRGSVRNPSGSLKKDSRQAGMTYYLTLLMNSLVNKMWIFREMCGTQRVPLSWREMVIQTIPYYFYWVRISWCEKVSLRFLFRIFGWLLFNSLNRFPGEAAKFALRIQFNNFLVCLYGFFLISFF